MRDVPMTLQRSTVPKEQRLVLEWAQLPFSAGGSSSVYLVLSEQYFGWTDRRPSPFGSPGEDESFNLILLKEIREVEYLCTPLALHQWLRVSWAAEQGRPHSIDFKVSDIRQWH